MAIGSSSGFSIFEWPLWLSQSLSPDSPHLSVAYLFTFGEGFDAARFAEAWRLVVEEEPILRSRIEFVEGNPRRVESATAPELSEWDLRGAADPQAAARTWCRERCSAPLAIATSMVDAVLVRLDEARYAWYLNCHHLITDGVASRLLYERVGERYSALGAGPPAAAPDFSRARRAGYLSQVSRLRESAAGAAGDTAREYWRSKLGARLRRNAIYGRDVLPSTTPSSRRTISLGAEQMRRLEELVKLESFVSISPNLSRFVVFATLLAAWIGRCSDRETIDFDVPMRNRPSRGARETLGAFIEFFPFVVALEEGDSFLTLGRRCRVETLGQVRHAVPGAGPLTAATASNAVLNFVTDSFGAHDDFDPQVEWIHPGHTDLAHAVRMQVERFDEQAGYRIHLDLNQEIFPEVQGELALGHFQRLLHAMLDDPGQRVSAVEVLSDEESTRQLVDFNRTDGVSRPALSVVDRWFARCEETPDAVAIRDDRCSLTYRALRERVTTFATELDRRGVGPGDCVVVLMPRSLDAVVAILSVLSVRATYVPADPSDPPRRVQHIVNDCAPALVLVCPGEGALAERYGLQYLELSEDSITQRGSTDVLPPVRMTDRAYLIYTSGSTGKPKGIPIDHAGLADYIDWADRQYVRGRRWTFPLFSSLSFDLTVTSLYLPLVTGGTLVVYPAPEGPVDTSLMDVLGENAVSFLKLTPSHLSLLRRRDFSNSNLHCVVVGGEDLKAELARTISSQFNDAVEIYNEYGPTEAVVGCMVHRFEPDRDVSGSVPIGRPSGSTRLYVLNRERMLVPEGVAGELHIGRDGLTAGYLNRDDLNSTQFLDSPFRERERLYRSGDLVRFSRPGGLEYLGRMDRQLKVSGVRVEAGEIESALLTHPAVSQCVVARRESRLRPDAWLAPVNRCTACGLPDNYPGAEFDENGACAICRDYERVRERAEAYFGSRDALLGTLGRASAKRSGQHDCMMLFSGGKDSTYALCQVVDLGFKVHAYTLDNGYISPGAKENIIRVTQSLGVSHEFATTPHMNDIFRDSLERFSNVCNGCFKTIYTLGMLRARDLGIKAIVTGLSRGQFFETRLSERMFRDSTRASADIDAAVLDARKAYHRFSDAVTRCIDSSAFQGDAIFEEIAIVDFYRYWMVSLEKVYRYLSERTPWVRPQDTGRSTNCLINDVGIYVHKRERGFHNYALPYSWDVRLGHKNRTDAIRELDDDIDQSRVGPILANVGYPDPAGPMDGSAATLLAWYVADRAVDRTELRRHLAGELAPALIPAAFYEVDRIPLTASGKVSFDELDVRATGHVTTGHDAEPLVGDVEPAVARVLCEVLGRDWIGVTESFFELGGTSLAGMDVMLRLSEIFEIELPLKTIFVKPTIRELALEVEDQVLASINALSEEAAAALLGGSDLA